MKPKTPWGTRPVVPHRNNPDYQHSPARQLRNGWVELDGARIADAALLARKGSRSA